MASKTNNSKIKLGIRARQDALQTLIKENQARFDEMVESNRVRLGLPRKATSETPEEIEAKLERARQRLARYEEQLAQAKADRKLTTTKGH